MATGYLFKDVCYPTLAGATSAHWSGYPGAIVPGTTSYIADVVWSGAAWVVKRYTMNASGVLSLNSTTALPAVAFETCDTKEQFMDGMAVGWGIAAAMLAATVLLALKKGMP